MEKIISVSQIKKITQKFKKDKRSICLVGGCFDILHPGHVIFLEKAKKEADILIVMLESDQKVKMLKGLNRPVHNQKERAQVLSSVGFVDYVVMLPFLNSESEYDSVIDEISPDIIAATKGGANVLMHQRSAVKVGASFKFVTNIIGNHSSSRILNHKK